MAERRLLVDIAIDANNLSCGSCMYLVALASGYKCGLLTGQLEEGTRGPMRADECLGAEARFKREVTTDG